MKLRHILFLIAATTLILPGLTYAAETKTQVKMLSIEITAKEKSYFEGIEKAFETANPDIDVVIEYLDDESLKTKLPTLLQSRKKPHIFFSWGGGAFYEQAQAGVLQDITGQLKGIWSKNMSSAGIDAFTYNDRIYGAPMYAAQVVFWYNNELAAKGGIDPSKIKTWDQFLNVCEILKKAGITPIIVGGKDKWPLHFYYSYLAVRIAGKEGIEKANRGENGGFACSEFIRVGDEFKRLVDLQPFQSGFMDSDYGKSAGLFGDGRGVFHLMGNWDYPTQRDASTTKKGLSDSQLGVLDFPTVAGGKGQNADTFGGINGWLVSKGAPKEAVDWLKFMLNQENQRRAGKEGFWIPVAKGADSEIANPFFQKISQNIANSDYHQLFLDQALGASVGGTVNDISADLAQNAVTPKKAAEQIHAAWEMR